MILLQNYFDNDRANERAKTVATGQCALAHVSSIQTIQNYEEQKVILDCLAKSSCLWSNVIPYVISTPWRTFNCGYAAHPWVIDLYQWSLMAPDIQKNRIADLLSGYSLEIIQKNELHRLKF